MKNKEDYWVKHKNGTWERVNSLYQLRSGDKIYYGSDAEIVKMIVNEALTKKEN